MARPSRTTAPLAVAADIEEEMMSKDELLPVTQEDRESAATLYRPGATWIEKILSGSEDKTCEVQAFARHRLASLEQADQQPAISPDVLAQAGEALALYDDALEIMFDGPDQRDEAVAYNHWKKAREKAAVVTGSLAIAEPAIRADERERVLAEVASHLSACQYDPAPYTCLKTRMAAIRKAGERVR